MATDSELTQSLKWFKDQLKENIDFWMTKSIDHKHGGYYNCLNSKGEIYDTTKYCWLQGRQVWMLAKLYNETEDYRRTDILDAAIKGGDFLLNHVKVKDQLRCYFAVTEDGRPIKLQRKPYTECFYIIGLWELYRATSDDKYQVAAEEMLERLIHWICVDDSDLVGGPVLSGAPPTRELGRPMMLLNVLTEVCQNDTKLREKYSEHFKWSVDAILKHSDGEWVHEHVLKTGGFPTGCQGRQTTPGHAIEGGWFLLQESETICDDNLRDIAIKLFIDMPWKTGWDQQYGGFYYFLDTEGECSTYLEWSLKLWWVHCEALIASLMAYQATGDSNHWSMFKQVFEYVNSHFIDSENGGEWFGYLTREGKINQSFKGGPFKAKSKIKFQQILPAIPQDVSMYLAVCICVTSYYQRNSPQDKLTLNNFISYT